ncbi:alpha/beta hydrolase family protein [Streptomyces sp. NPDC048172]|uniref:alpha/beta hydrolase family protein n=1 Tax=Streptomyces sp. NPDC048172 TaxID=3365505 RepID=UPI00371A3459
MDVREVAFGSAGVRLVGTLALPRREAAADGPGVPGVVMIGGSGDSDRDNGTYFPPLRRCLADAGFAVLSYDKRGVGASSGDWRAGTLAELADDASAARDFLRGTPGADPARVGFLGHSEGGWAALLAATGRDDVPWLVTSGCPAVTPAVQGRHELTNLVRASATASGSATPDEESALALYDRLTEAGRRGADFGEARELVRAAGSPPWVAELWGELDAALWGFLARKQDHDPLPGVRGLRCPHLAAYGAADPLVPVAESVRLLAAANGEAGRALRATLTAELFPGADHRVQVDAGTRLAPGYPEALLRWLRNRTV